MVILKADKILIVKLYRTILIKDLGIEFHFNYDFTFNKGILLYT